MRPFSVGKIDVDPPVLLAPMEDVTNAAFRKICKRIANPGLMFTEFVSAMAIHHGATKTYRKMRILDEERPLAIQIFGGEIDVMSKTAILCEEMGADIVDINMGCWVPKVCRTGAGAALLKDPELAEKIVAAVVKSVSIPVTVKVRAGWDYGLFAAPELAKRFENAGAKMLTLHARFAKQGFEGEANWQLIEEMRKAIAIPLIGNGDIKCGNDAIKMFCETGCDGVMIGRAAISNPWALREIVQRVTGNSISPPPNLSERIQTALEHLKTMVELELADGVPEESTVRSLRGQIPLYVKGAFGAASIRQELMQAKTVTEVETVLDGFLHSVAAVAH